MSAESALANVTSVYKTSTRRELVNSYGSWAKTYDTDMDFLEYSAPGFGADLISSHFSGDREAAVVLDVACGTGLVAKQLSTHGFRHFVGVDGSEDMLELARLSGMYQELKQCLLGEEPLSVQWGTFDVVAIIGGLSWNHVPANVVPELYKSAKPGGYICMTVRDTDENAEFRAGLERDMKQMEEEHLWTCVTISEGKPYRRGVGEQKHDFIPAVVYLYRKEPMQHSA